MPHDNVLVHSIQHVLEVSHLPVAFGCTVWAIGEAIFNCCTRPQVALPSVAVASIIGHLLRPHTIDIKVVQLRDYRS